MPVTSIPPPCLHALLSPKQHSAAMRSPRPNPCMSRVLASVRPAQINVDLSLAWVRMTFLHNIFAVI